MLGGSASSNDILKRDAQVKNDNVTLAKVLADRDSFGVNAGNWIDSELWLLETRKAGRQYAYTAGVLEPVSLQPEFAVALRWTAERDKGTRQAIVGRG